MDTGGLGDGEVDERHGDDDERGDEPVERRQPGPVGAPAATDGLVRETGPAVVDSTAVAAPVAPLLGATVPTRSALILGRAKRCARPPLRYSPILKDLSLIH